MFSLDGVPLLYNGMEVGDATESGDPALFEKLPIVWNPRERPPLREIYHSLIQLRKQYPAFRNHHVVWLKNSDEADLVTLMRLDGNGRVRGRNQFFQPAGFRQGRSHEQRRLQARANFWHVQNGPVAIFRPSIWARLNGGFIIAPYRIESCAPASTASPFMQKPQLSFWQIWNMSFGFLGHPVRLGPADGQYERHLRLPRCERRFPRHPLAGRARHRSHHPAIDRPVQRPLLDATGSAPALYPGRRDSRLARPGLDAELPVGLDGGRITLGAGRNHQRQHAAFPRAWWRTICRRNKIRRASRSSPCSSASVEPSRLRCHG